MLLLFTRTGAKLRKKVLPGEQHIDPDTTNREAKKIISQIVNALEEGAASSWALKNRSDRIKIQMIT